MVCAFDEMTTIYGTFKSHVHLHFQKHPMFLFGCIEMDLDTFPM